MKFNIGDYVVSTICQRILETNKKEIVCNVIYYTK
jgi:hypothetical protein